MVFIHAAHFSANRYKKYNAKQENMSSLSSIKSAAVEEILRIYLYRMPFDCLLLEFRVAVGIQVIPRRSHGWHNLNGPLSSGTLDLEKDGVAIVLLYRALRIRSSKNGSHLPCLMPISVFKTMLLYFCGRGFNHEPIGFWEVSKYFLITLHLMNSQSSFLAFG